MVLPRGLPLSFGVVPGSTVHLECSAIAYPPPLLTWYKNGDVLNQTWPTHTDLALRSKTAVVQPFKNTKFKCTAVNSEGVATVKYNITVTGLNKSRIIFYSLLTMGNFVLLFEALVLHLET